MSASTTAPSLAEFPALATTPPVPSVHLNGTAGDDLLDQQLAAMRALRSAHEALRAAAPNGRDFYPQGPEAFSAAQDDHRAELQVLATLIARHEALAEAIVDRTRP
jgi:hypothetical protein